MNSQAKHHKEGVMLKRWIVSIGMGLLLLAGAGQANAATPVNVVVDGTPMSLSKPAVTMNGYTIIPMKDIFERLGASVSWDGDNEIVTAQKEEINVQLKIGSPVAQINGVSYLLPVKAQIFEGRTMVPLRFVSQALGCHIGWDGDTFTAYVDSNSIPGENQLDQSAIDDLVTKMDTEIIVGSEPNQIGLTEKEAMIAILLPDDISRKKWEALSDRSKRHLLYQIVQKKLEPGGNHFEHRYTIVKFGDTLLMGADLTANIDPDEIKLVDGNILLSSYQKQQSDHPINQTGPDADPDADII